MRRKNYRGLMAIANVCAGFMLAGPAAASGNSVNEAIKSENPAACVTNRAKLDMLHSLTDLEQNRSGGKGRIYELDYTLDYNLSEALKSQIVGLGGLSEFMQKNLFDVVPAVAPAMSMGAGCSAYAATEVATGHFLMGRNYDFCHKAGNGEDEIAAIMVRTSPPGGKKSISMVDGYWLGFKKGFYTDGVTDLSMLLAAPFAPMDGINEDGFAVGVLHLDGLPAIQSEPGLPTIYISVALRMLLDRASTVKEAIEMLKGYNMNMESPAAGSYHFFMADATGDYAIVEYVSANGDVSHNPSTMHVMGRDGGDKNRYVTNFYVSSHMAGSPYDISSGHGRDRYEKLESVLSGNACRLSADKAMDLLEYVSQAPKLGDLTSHTQWSSLYDLTKKTLRVALLREYGKKEMFDFKIGK